MNASLNSCWIAYSHTCIETTLSVSLPLVVHELYKFWQELHPRPVLCQKTDVESLSLFPPRLKIHQAELARCLWQSVDCTLVDRLWVIEHAIEVFCPTFQDSIFIN